MGYKCCTTKLAHRLLNALRHGMPGLHEFEEEGYCIYPLTVLLTIIIMNAHLPVLFTNWRYAFISIIQKLTDCCALWRRIPHCGPTGLWSFCRFSLHRSAKVRAVFTCESSLKATYLMC
ncbi:hypothetical protein AVEN_258435-1 [Araneus ventricosus]|uniref:Uncharacterized protein n=1 Tax=Araneus ventricosus TaxID=182803 RepID=A0A4Y2DGQ9_ARAVE|nr:hypothetical protein AVEN_258435-1 [Araneus ventricosus]